MTSEAKKSKSVIMNNNFMNCILLFYLNKYKKLYLLKNKLYVNTNYYYDKMFIPP